jgi:hypothetical protein
MIHLGILLFYFFHYGRAQTLHPGVIPLLVRSPSLTCWGASPFGDPSLPIESLPIDISCDQSDWSLTLNKACYFLDRHNTKIDSTVEP